MYKEDILKDGFEQQSLPLKEDYEGKAIATLIRRLFPAKTAKAVLYIHGFNDYFFQKEMALQFNEHHFNFYALDLRKYGRSYMPHQKFNDIRDIRAYFEEITDALRIIHNEGNREVLLLGHSTGGLIITLYAKEYKGSKLFQGIILNSPFFKFNVSPLQKFFIPIAAFLGKFFPRIKVSGGFTEAYGIALHKDYNGEWDYNLLWKPNVAPKVNLGWIRAINTAQEDLRKNLLITKPILILHADKSLTDTQNELLVKSSDVILNVNDIKELANTIQGDVEVVAVEGGIHDLLLSSKTVREQVYQIIFRWIDLHLNKKS
jgi:alpha-beta hydrolase superfamily lysophospholipase